MSDRTPSAGEQCAVTTLSQCFFSSNGALETVAWLLRRCPHQARAFALAMHELAAWQYDDNRTELRRDVICLLPENQTSFRRHRHWFLRG
jgi:hypothetical protein